MAINMKVKNTFLEVKLDSSSAAQPEQRRSSSLPRAFKPGCTAVHLWDDDHSTSVSASEMFECCQTVLSDMDYQDCLLDSSDWSSEFGIQQADTSCEDLSSEICQPSEEDFLGNDDVLGNAKVTLSLVSMVGKTDEREDMCSKLRSRAQPFHSVMASPEEISPPKEMKSLINRAMERINCRSEVIDVHMRDGQGGTVMIVARCLSLNDTSTIPAMKDALLKAAAESEKTYVMGYNARPFNDLGAHSFSAKIAVLPEGHKSTACWETYTQGSCPRCNKCRWSHPAESDTLRIIFVLKAVM
jgi:hypothetical protein